MSYVLGIDLGTSSIKIAAYDESGSLIGTSSASYPLIIDKPGYSEQNPKEWINGFKKAIKTLLAEYPQIKDKIEGLAIAGQMHSLVLLDDNNEVIRNAILWNDVRTSKECEYIYDNIDIVKLTQNKALEGFTLPKLLWVKNNENENWAKIKKFMMPKDYLVYYLTGQYSTDYSDAAGTLLLDFKENNWSREIFNKFEIDIEWAPNIYWSTEKVGVLKSGLAKELGLNSKISVFAGAADNAAAALSAGIVNSDKSMVSIGTSGVFLSSEENNLKKYNGQIHYFNHSIENEYYSMGVTLSAGSSLSWIREILGKNIPYEVLLANIKNINPGSDGLFFAPYIMGERTPYTDSKIRGSFIGLSIEHTRDHLLRAVLEGITYSLKDSKVIMESLGKNIKTIVSVGGGAKNPDWLQMQADIFETEITTLTNEEGPAQGAAMISFIGLNKMSVEESIEKFVTYGKYYYPSDTAKNIYSKLYKVYTEIYDRTKEINYKSDELLNS